MCLVPISQCSCPLMYLDPCDWLPVECLLPSRATNTPGLTGSTGEWRPAQVWDLGSFCLQSESFVGIHQLPGKRIGSARGLERVVRCEKKPKLTS